MFYIVLVLILPVSVYGIGRPHYECGEFGRFEYCLDNVPGCVVGCHCHPGYYFDTESKICESNSKLALGYRRRYPGESPTRVPDIFLPSEPELEPTPTTTASAAEVNKDTDDLGDWLYNQFFKTIESQVINNTDEVAGKAKPLTRRTNSNPKTKKSVRKKSRKKKSKRKANRKKDDLRRKLLRITEDDSLFDSRSKSESDSDGDSSSDDSDSTTDSDSSCDDNSGDHDHRKFVAVKKKEKPPLPSFIFLPNLETPFFPPLGLVPPPMPLYPMVPIPPLLMVTPPEPCKNTSETTTNTPVTSTKPNSSGEKKPQEKPEHKSQEKPEDKSQEKPEDNPQEKPEDKSQEKPVDNGEKPEDNGEKPEDNGENTNNPDTVDTLRIKKRTGKDKGRKYMKPKGNKHKNRKKQLKENMINEIKKMKKMKRKMMEDDDYDTLTLNDVEENPDMRNLPPENVDFKYIAQLIHKPYNKTVETKPNAVSTSTPLLSSEKHYLLESTANRTFENIRHLETPDESYYSTLGQQIAELIRKLDTRDKQRIEVEQQKALKTFPESISLTFRHPPPLTLETNYVPKTYWDRSVRSLLETWPSKSDNEYYLRKNKNNIFNDESLFNIENKIETIATTTRPLSLNDLENFVALIDRTKPGDQRKSTENPKLVKSNDNSLNINLLPHPNYEQKESNTKLGPLVHKEYEFNEIRKLVPNVLLHRFSNNADIVNIQKDITEAQNKLRRVILQSFQRVNNERNDFKNNLNLKMNNPYVIDLKNIQSVQNHSPISINKLETINSKNNIPLNKNYSPSVQQTVNKNVNETLPHNPVTGEPSIPPWLRSKLADILTHPESSSVYVQHPLEMQFNLTPIKHKYRGENNDRLSYRGISSLPLLKRAFRHPPPSNYFHHEIQHLDMIDK